MSASRSAFGSIAAGAVAAAVVSFTLPGLGWLIAGLAVVVAVCLGSRDRNAPDRGSRVLAGGAALLLLSSGMIRAAGWVLTLCVLVAIPLAAYAVSGGRSWQALGRSLVRPLAVAPAASSWLRDVRPPRSRVAVIRAIAIGLLLVAVFGVLFAAAEPRFRELFSGTTITPARLITSALVFVTVGIGTLLLAYAHGTRDDFEIRPWTRRMGRVDWVVPVAFVDLIFVAFVLKELPVLFGGTAYVMRDGGPDFAVYARNGFIELVVVTLLTLAIVAVVGFCAPRETRTDQALIRGLVGVLCVLTLVVIWSALFRMQLYSDAYGFSRTRLLADLVEIWLGLVFIAVLLGGITLKATWLPRTVVGLLVACLLGLVAVNPDAYIARSMMRRPIHGYDVDTSYLFTLSADAADELAKLPAPASACYLSAVLSDHQHSDPWYAFNYGRAHARQLLRRHLTDPSNDCGTAIEMVSKGG